MEEGVDCGGGCTSLEKSGGWASAAGESASRRRRIPRRAGAPVICMAGWMAELRPSVGGERGGGVRWAWGACTHFSMQMHRLMASGTSTPSTSKLLYQVDWNRVRSKTEHY